VKLTPPRCTRPPAAVPLLEPHAAELEGLITQLREALQALGAMVAGTVSLERCGLRAGWGGWFATSAWLDFWGIKSTCQGWKGRSTRANVWETPEGRAIISSAALTDTHFAPPILMQRGSHRGGAGAACAGAARWQPACPSAAALCCMHLLPPSAALLSACKSLLRPAFRMQHLTPPPSLPLPPSFSLPPLQHLMLRVLVSGAPEGLSSVDANQGLAFLAMLFNVTSVVSVVIVHMLPVVFRAAFSLCIFRSRGGGQSQHPWLRLRHIQLLVKQKCIHPRCCKANQNPPLPCAPPQARLLCLSLGEAFCADDAEGQEAAAELLRDTSRWAADDRLQVGGG